jgi:hypothetical protein
MMLSVYQFNDAQRLSVDPVMRTVTGKKKRKNALNWTRLSCKHFLSNQVRFGLFVLAYNLGNFLQRLVLPSRIKHLSLRTLLVKLINTGAKVQRHSRYVIFQMAEVAIRKEIFAEILSRINRLRCCSQQ